MVDIVSTFVGPRLEIARESRGLNQMDLVRLSGLSQSQISKFETGEKIPNNNELKLFSKIFDYPINFLLKRLGMKKFTSIIFEKENPFLRRQREK